MTVICYILPFIFNSVQWVQSASHVLWPPMPCRKACSVWWGYPEFHHKTFSETRKAAHAQGAYLSRKQSIWWPVADSRALLSSLCIVILPDFNREIQQVTWWNHPRALPGPSALCSLPKQLRSTPCVSSLCSWFYLLKEEWALPPAPTQPFISLLLHQWGIQVPSKLCCSFSQLWVTHRPGYQASGCGVAGDICLQFHHTLLIIRQCGCINSPFYQHCGVFGFLHTVVQNLMLLDFFQDSSCQSDRCEIAPQILIFISWIPGEMDGVFHC